MTQGNFDQLRDLNQNPEFAGLVQGAILEWVKSVVPTIKLFDMLTAEQVKAVGDVLEWAKAQPTDGMTEEQAASQQWVQANGFQNVDIDLDRFILAIDNNSVSQLCSTVVASQQYFTEGDPPDTMWYNPTTKQRAFREVTDGILQWTISLGNSKTFDRRPTFADFEGWINLTPPS